LFAFKLDFLRCFFKKYNLHCDYLSNGDSVSLSKNHQKVAVKTGIKEQDYIQILSWIDENSSIELVDQ
jgi:hypothetical protein